MMSLASTRTLLLLFSLALLHPSLSPLSLTAASSCVVLDYDLSPLSTTDLIWKDTAKNSTYIYRPCQASPSCPSHSNFCRLSLADPSSSPTSLSAWPSSTSGLHPTDTSASTSADGIGVVLRTTQWGGSRCSGPLGGEHRVTVEWVCNPLAEVGVLGVREENDCVFDAAITSKFLCQRNHKGGQH